MSYTLKDWDYSIPREKNTKKVNFAGIMIAPRFSGKTNTIISLIQTSFIYEFDKIVVYTTVANRDVYVNQGGIKLNDIIIDDEKMSVLKSLVESNEKFIKEKEKPINILVIFDDTISRKQKYNDQILNLFVRGRHSFVSVLYSSQTPTLVDNIWKGNSDLIFIWKPNTSKDREYIVKNIMLGVLNIGFEKSKSEYTYYKKILDIITSEEHQCVVIDFRRRQIFGYLANKII
jgi:Poxvirus A32 protein